MIRAFKFRAYPNSTQVMELNAILDVCREIHNAGLQERREAYRTQGLTLSYTDQSRELPETKKLCPEVGKVYAQVLQDVLNRLHKSFHAFFQRVKSGQKPGFPRFKGRDRYDSFTFPQIMRRVKGKPIPGGGVKIVNGRVEAYGITGPLKVKFHRPILGSLKTCTFKREGDHWYAIFVCDNVPMESRESTGQNAALDLGIESFATLDTGERIENPRLLEMAEKKIVFAQRSLSRKKRGSSRRNKARKILAKAHRRVSNARKDFHHKTARDLVNRFDRVGIEDLNTKGLADGMLAKQVRDVGWGQFTAILVNKAEGAGCQVIAVDPRNTSQTCASCGARVEKKLSEREHDCPECGFHAHRDHNAALVIRQRAFGNGSGRDLQGDTSVGAAAEAVVGMC